MQNKAKFQKVKFYVSRVSTKGYVKRTLGGMRKTKPNKANSKPIQSQSKPICRMLKMNVNKVLTKEYEKMSNWAIYPKQTQFKPKQTQPVVSLSNLFPINERRTMNNELITIKADFTPTPKPVKAVRRRISAFGPRPYGNERDEKYRSRHPLIDPICPLSQPDCLEQMPILGKEAIIMGILWGLLKKWFLTNV